MSQPPSDKKFLTVLGIGVVLGLLLFLLDIVGWLQPIHNGVDYLVTPWQVGVGLVYKNLANRMLSVQHMSSLRQENIDLRKELLLAQGRLVQQCKMEKQAHDALKQFNSVVDQANQVQQVQVVQVNPVGYNGYLKVNGGAGQGLSVGQVVLYQNYFVGKVSQVGAHTALVSTLFSGQYSLPVKVWRKKQSHGVVSLAKEGLVLEGVSQDARLKKGDKIVTWSDSLPLDLTIGTVLEIISKPSESTQRAKIALPVDYSDLDYLYVVIKW